MEDPNTEATLAALSPGCGKAVTTPGYRYVLGSVLTRFCSTSQSSDLSKIALEMLDEYPDIVIGCAGGGSNLAAL